MGEPLGYFISFRTYGSWLHGDDRGSVDREHRRFGEPFVEPNEIKEECERERMKGPAVTLSDEQRLVVERTVREVAKHRRWTIHALNVRSNHVHVVVTAIGVAPEKVMNDFKAWATRRLREAGLAGDGKIWSRHGSTPHLYDDGSMHEAIVYVTERQ